MDMEVGTLGVVLTMEIFYSIQEEGYPLGYKVLNMKCVPLWKLVNFDPQNGFRRLHQNVHFLWTIMPLKNPSNEVIYG